MSDVLLRPVTADDAEALVALHHACWVEAYTGLLGAERIAAVFADPTAHAERRRQRVLDGADDTLLAVRDGVLVGFASAGPARRPDGPTPLELYALYTRAAEWGRGTGRLLIEAALDVAPAHLWVLAGNDRAQAFYAKHGFAPDGGVDDEHPMERHLRMTRPGLAASTS